MPHDPFAWAALAGAAFAVPILLWFLVRRPALGRSTKIMLLLGIGVFPLLTAGTGNIAGYEATKTRRFCGSCHVMTPYAADSENVKSTSLASIHSRNEAFGGENCYACHADYGMFGTVTTKIGGLNHVYQYTTKFHRLTVEEALPQIHLRRPFRNERCMRCHSTAAPSWSKVPDHDGLLDELRSDAVSCVGSGCHGPAHPFSKPAAVEKPTAVDGHADPAPAASDPARPEVERSGRPAATPAAVTP